MALGTLGFLTAATMFGASALSGSAVAASDSDIISFDAPGADTHAGDGNGTFPTSINDFGVIVGSALDAKDVYHGFLRYPNGQFARFDIPGAGATQGSYEGTSPNSINDLGDVTGSYTDASGTSHGFIRSATGQVTRFDPPNSVATVPVAINLQGAVVGYYADAGAEFHAFLRQVDGTLVSFDGPGVCTGGTAVGCYGSAAFNINIFGVVAAAYGDASGNFVSHGLIRSPAGKLTVYEAPGAGKGAYQGTGCPGCAIGINAAGAIAGIYTDAKGVYHTYLRTPEGGFVPINAAAAGTASGEGTGCASDCSVSLNDQGEVTGNYIDASGNYHGFYRASSGTVVTVDPKLSVATFPSVINGPGALTGTYLDANQVYHGFVRLSSQPD